MLNNSNDLPVPSNAAARKLAKAKKESFIGDYNTVAKNLNTLYNKFPNLSIEEIILELTKLCEVNKLTADQKKCLELIRDQNYTHKDAALELGITPAIIERWKIDCLEFKDALEKVRICKREAAKVQMQESVEVAVDTLLRLAQNNDRKASTELLKITGYYDEYVKSNQSSSDNPDLNQQNIQINVNLATHRESE